MEPLPPRYLPPSVKFFYPPVGMNVSNDECLSHSVMVGFATKTITYYDHAATKIFLINRMVSLPTKSKASRRDYDVTTSEKDNGARFATHIIA